MTVASVSPGRATGPDELDRRLHEVFHGMAATRTRAQDEALLDAAIAAAETRSPLCAELRRMEAALGRGFPRAA